MTGIASLVVALVFNALAVRDSAHQERATKLATELQLLTTLNGLVTQSQTTIDPRSQEFLRAEQGPGVLSKRTNTNFSATLKNMNYLAWLFNNGFVAIPGARGLWARSMNCLYATALLVYGPTVRLRLKDLDRFVHPGQGKSVIRLRNINC